MNRKEFSHKVYDIVRDIPFGKVATYGMIALLSGYPGRSRMVGQALHHASDFRHIPCHRVVNHRGRLAPGWADQKELLIKEGVCFKENGCVNLKEHLWDFTCGAGISK